ncbi:MAG: HAMP domain-containing sensor histidine kinase [Planctomycetota bacterium]
MSKRIRISLANKCQLLFGLGVVLIVTAALFVVAMRMDHLAEQGPRQRARDLAGLWISGRIELVVQAEESDTRGNPEIDPGMRIEVLGASEAGLRAEDDGFLRDAFNYFDSAEDTKDYFATRSDVDGQQVFLYARAVRLSEMGDRDPVTQSADVPTEDPLEKMILIQLVDEEASKQRTLNLIYLIAAGLTAGLFAVAAFWFITTRLVLSPVRVLRGYAEKVSGGDLNIRSDINTGDEFEQLSDMFNAMLDTVRSTQDRLTSANKSLDLKLGELAESNVALFEANQIKGEFLANVSHELRTPLNSIIGFAEILQETLTNTDHSQSEKQARYTTNIILSSRRLLELITDLLDLAKIEAGRAELRLATVSIKDTAEGLTNLIRPQAEKRGIEIKTKVQPNLPATETDAGKLQQILFNFLSNAIKFSPDKGVVTLQAELEPHGGRSVASLRLSVSDQGSGIAPEDHDRVFEKFSQVDASTTREHGGTGLGLTISKELAQLLGGTIELQSTVGEGAVFTLVIPLIYQPPSAPLMPEA